MKAKNDRTYSTKFTEEKLSMDKYTELLKDIARLIADTERENILLKYDLERVKQQLEKAEDQLETVVAKQAVAMEKGRREYA